MQPGNIILINLPQSDGSYKLRPALILKLLPKYNDFLVCGISTQLHQSTQGFDEILDEHETYFPETGLRKTSLIRLAFLAIVSTEKISGSIGKIQPTMLKDLLQRLATFIVS